MQTESFAGHVTLEIYDIQASSLCITKTEICIFIIAQFESYVTIELIEDKKHQASVHQ